MTLQFSFRHMPGSDFLRAYTKKHLTNIISRHFNEIFLMNVTFANEKQFFTARCCAYGKKHYSFTVEDRSDNMLTAVNNMIEKLKLKINRKRSCNTKRKKQGFSGKPGFEEFENTDESNVIDASDIIALEGNRTSSSRRRNNMYSGKRYNTNQSVQLKPGLRKRSQLA